MRTIQHGGLQPAMKSAEHTDRRPAGGRQIGIALLLGWICAWPLSAQSPELPGAEPATEATAPSTEGHAMAPDATAVPSVDAAGSPPSPLPAVPPQQALEAARAFADAKMLAEGGQLAKALAAYDKALALDGRDPYAHLEMAQFLAGMAQMTRGERRRAEQLATAAEHASQARELAPENPDILLQYAQLHLRLVEQNRLESVPLATEAYEAYRHLADEEDLRVLTSLGQLYLWQRRGVEAAEVLRLAADLRPSVPTVHLMLVEALLGSDQKREAETVLERLIVLSPQAAEHRLRLAELRSERGDHRGAVEVLLQSNVDLDESPRLRQVLARELHLSGDNQRALALADSLLSEMPSERGLYRLRVAIFSALGRYEDAIDTLRPLIEPAGQDSERRAQDLRLLSRLLERVGRPLEAADALQQLLADGSLDKREELRHEMALVALWERHDMADKSIDLLQRRLEQATEPEEQVVFARLLSDLYRGLDDPEAAQQVLDGVSLRFGDDQEVARETLALHALPALLATEQWQAAEASGRQLMSSQDADIRFAATLLRAQALAHLDRLDEALASLQLESPEDDAARRRFLADRLELMFEHGREEEASRELQALAADSSLEDLFFAAQVWQGQGRYAEALPLLEGVLAQRPESIQALFLYGAAQERLGQREEAVEAFERLLEVEPDHPPALNYLGYMWVEEGQHLDQALHLIQRAVAFSPDNGAYVDSLGWAFYKLGHYQEAKLHLEWAARLVPDDPTIHDHLGDLYLVLEETEQAKQAFRKAIDLGGDGVETVRHKLQSLTEGDS